MTSKEIERRRKAVLNIIKRGQKCKNSTMSFTWKTDENHQYATDAFTAVLLTNEYVLNNVPEVAVDTNTPNIQGVFDKLRLQPVTDYVILRAKNIKARILDKAYQEGYRFNSKLAQITFKDIKTYKDASVAFDPNIFKDVMEAIIDNNDTIVAIEIRGVNSPMILENLSNGGNKAFGIVTPLRHGQDHDEHFPPYFYTKACTYTEEEKMKFHERYLDKVIVHFWKVAKNDLEIVYNNLVNTKFEIADKYLKKVKKSFSESNLRIYHCSEETKVVIKECEEIEKKINELHSKIGLPNASILLKEKTEESIAEEKKQEEAPREAKEEPKKEEKILLLPSPKKENEVVAERQEEIKEDDDEMAKIKKALLDFDFSCLA